MFSQVREIRKGRRGKRASISFSKEIETDDCAALLFFLLQGKEDKGPRDVCSCPRRCHCRCYLSPCSPPSPPTLSATPLRSDGCAVAYSDGLIVASTPHVCLLCCVGCSLFCCTVSETTVDGTGVLVGGSSVDVPAPDVTSSRAKIGRGRPHKNTHRQRQLPTHIDSGDHCRWRSVMMVAAGPMRRYWPRHCWGLWAIMPASPLGRFALLGNEREHLSRTALIQSVTATW